VDNYRPGQGRSPRALNPTVRIFGAIAKVPAQGILPERQCQTARSAKHDVSFFPTSRVIPKSLHPVRRMTGSIDNTSTVLPVDMWTIGQSPNGYASPVLLRTDGEMLAFDHIPTGNHHNNKEGFKILIGREGKGPVFFAREGAKNLPVPRQKARF
jgi:hypothetical protein